MSRRWRIAGVVLATIAFAATFTGPAPDGDAFLVGVAPILRAAFYAISTFIGVWLYEGLYHGVLWVACALFPDKQRPVEWK